MSIIKRIKYFFKPSETKYITNEQMLKNVIGAILLKLGKTKVKIKISDHEYFYFIQNYDVVLKIDLEGDLYFEIIKLNESNNEKILEKK